jgi:hypothetical protein
MHRPEHPTYSGRAVVNVETHHEESDVNVRALLWFMAIFVVFAIVTHIALFLLFKFYVQLERGDANAPLTSIARPEDAAVPREPRLQPFPIRDEKGRAVAPYANTPVTDMVLMRENEDQVLLHYGWVDAQKGIVHIPIAEAKKLALQRGAFPVTSVAVAPGAPATNTAPVAAAPATTTQPAAGAAAAPATVNRGEQRP